MAAANITTVFREPLHPYYPPNAQIATYAANKDSVAYLLGVFFSACLALLTLTRHFALRINPKLTRLQLATTLWFVLSGSIHLFFEGYYVTHFATLASDQTVVGQMWKEYALSDSRYLTRSGLVLCMEGITMACWGPGCLLCAWMVVKGSPGRWSAVGLVSMGQLYGDVVYLATALFDHYVLDVSYSRPENYYFWFYFFLMNFIWIVVPGALIYQGILETTRAVRTVQQMEQSQKAK